MAAKNQKENTLLQYKGKPLVRSGNVIYYGDMADSHVAMLQFTDVEEFSDLKLPVKVTIQIVSTDEEMRPKDRIKKRTEKATLYEAVNIASIWLERILEDEQKAGASESALKQ